MRGLEGNESVDKQVFRLQSKQLELTLKVIQNSLPVVGGQYQVLNTTGTLKMFDTNLQ